MLINVDTSLRMAISPRIGQPQTYDLSEDMNRRLANSVDYGIVKNISPRKSSSTLTFSVVAGKSLSTYNQLNIFTRLNQTALPNRQAEVIKQIQLEQSSLSVRAGSSEPLRSDPLALDLDNDGFTTTGLANGVFFDLLAQGTDQRISVSQQNDPLLAFDRNHNGHIDNGTELFGDQSGHANGFEALAQYDHNGDNKIDHKDPIYSQLLLLHFTASGEQKTRSLSSSGIRSISLVYQQQHQSITHNDVIAQTGSFTRDDGSQGVAADLLLQVDIKI